MQGIFSHLFMLNFLTKSFNVKDFVILFVLLGGDHFAIQQHFLNLHNKLINLQRICCLQNIFWNPLLKMNRQNTINNHFHVLHFWIQLYILINQQRF